jgi:hypothetical protein
MQSLLALWIAIILLLIIAVIELWNPKLINEGFANLVSVGESAVWARWMPRRGDVSLDPTEEQDGYIRDIRYFAGYTDVQRLGKDHDFCRMVQSSTDKKDMFFACALGGTDGLTTVKYRTPSTKDGFEISRDDYMNDLGEGRAAYCRILKTDTDHFEAICNPAGDSSFKTDTVIDPNPPPHIKTMLQFYEGIVFWLRMKDDLLDYAKNLTVAKGGGIYIDEVPRPTMQGLEFNGDQFLRIGDTPNLEFGDVVQLRYVRAVSFWVYFDEFTNNAKIYDFGNGPGMDNVVVGIVGRGNMGVQNEKLKSCQDESQKTIPDAPSGAQCVHEQSPQTVMLTSSANVDLYVCPSPELFGEIVPPLTTPAAKPTDATTADLLYEIWDNKQRILHLQVKNVFPLKKWTHIAITTTSNTSFTSGLAIYKNGKVIHSEQNAPLPQTNYTKRNYIGKSNWSSATSNDVNADELFKGKLFDFRGYRTMMTEKKIKDTVSWGKELLGKELLGKDDSKELLGKDDLKESEDLS